MLKLVRFRINRWWPGQAALVSTTIGAFFRRSMKQHCKVSCFHSSVSLLSILIWGDEESIRIFRRMTNWCFQSIWQYCTTTFCNILFLKENSLRWCSSIALLVWQAKKMHYSLFDTFSHSAKSIIKRYLEVESDKKSHRVKKAIVLLLVLWSVMVSQIKHQNAW